MAFNVDYLGRVSSSANMDALKVWTYNASATGGNETLATVVASGYFNAHQQVLTSGSEVGPFSVGDVIMAHGNDASGFYQVTSITTNVVLDAYVAGLAPSHMVVYAAQPTTAGGAAAEAITVTGALATDLAFVQMVDDGTNNTTVVSAAVTADTLTVTFSADPGADAVINYQILRAVA